MIAESLKSTVYLTDKQYTKLHNRLYVAPRNSSFTIEFDGDIDHQGFTLSSRFNYYSRELISSITPANVEYRCWSLRVSIDDIGNVTYSTNNLYGLETKILVSRKRYKILSNPDDYYPILEYRYHSGNGSVPQLLLRTIEEIAGLSCIIANTDIEQNKMLRTLPSTWDYIATVHVINCDDIDKLQYELSMVGITTFSYDKRKKV